MGYVSWYIFRGRGLHSLFFLSLNLSLKKYLSFLGDGGWSCAQARVIFQSPGFSVTFHIFRQVFSPHFDFPASMDVMYYMDHIMYFLWIIEFMLVYLYSFVDTCMHHCECVPLFVCSQVPKITYIRSVTNACISVIYFLCIYTACNVPYYCFITCVADPSWSFSLRALQSASELHHSMVV